MRWHLLSLPEWLAPQRAAKKRKKPRLHEVPRYNWHQPISILDPAGSCGIFYLVVPPVSRPVQPDLTITAKIERNWWHHSLQPATMAATLSHAG